MHAVHVALQEGFIHDAVIVEIDDRPLFEEADVSTRLQLGLAASFETQVPSGSHALEIVLPQRGALRHVHSFNVNEDTWLGISLRPNGECEVRESTTPFGYL